MSRKYSNIETFHLVDKIFHAKPVKHEKNCLSQRRKGAKKNEL